MMSTVRQQGRAVDGPGASPSSDLHNLQPQALSNNPSHWITELAFSSSVQTWLHFVRVLTLPPPPKHPCPHGLKAGNTLEMKAASSQVAADGGRFPHWTFHWTTGALFLGISLRSKTAVGWERMLPSSSVRGRPGSGTTFGPMCFFSWLTWKTGWIWEDAGNSNL